MLEDLIDSSCSRIKSDLVIKNVNILSVITGEIKQGDIAIKDGIITGTYDSYEGNIEIDGTGLFAVPGFIDCHLHIESSLLTPFEFERCVLPKGTTTAVCDPHELSNVVGENAIKYFIDSASKLNMDLRVGLSSCVPATHMETSGFSVSFDELIKYKNHEKVTGLAEFMNYPGVLFKDPEVMKKIKNFDHIDGHAPLLSGKDLNAYITAGISNDHETTNIEEAKEKIEKGMHVFMREGTLCKDLKNLYKLVNEYNSMFLSLCTDDRNPLEIEEEGHLDNSIRMMIKGGIAPHLAYRVASLSGAYAFGFKDRGIIAPSKRADIVLLSDLENVKIEKVISNGKIVEEKLFQKANKKDYEFALNSVKMKKVSEDIFKITDEKALKHVIGIIPDKILTNHLIVDDITKEENIAKICVFHRHGKNNNVGKAYVKGFEFKKENLAIASTIGHDSHNLCVVGNSDHDMMIAVNGIIEMGGGFILVSNGEIIASLELPIGGLMSELNHEQVAVKLKTLKTKAKELITGTSDIFLQMGFLPLAVIPSLKLTDMGLVDVDKFELL
ncbi:MAG: Adenine deaminase [Alphaproteobacteria bacterium ADurb.Bin438]|nr:MAG: Adenine deaminase [Alphaproteobacteria bacterium ADurb.Bin438]